MLYELWEHECGHMFIPRDGDQAIYRGHVVSAKADNPDIRLTWTVEAATSNEAMQLLYDHKGYGRYRTLEEDLGETDEAD